MNFAISEVANYRDEKCDEIDRFLSGTYWEQPVWNIDSPFFRETGIRELNWDSGYKNISFLTFNPLMRREVQYIFGSQLEKRVVKLRTMVTYGGTIRHLGRFLSQYYPHITSVSKVPLATAFGQWQLYLKDLGLRYLDNHNSVFNKLRYFVDEFYDQQDEYRKDIWDAKKLTGVRIGPSGSTRLNFTTVPDVFKGLAKTFMRARLNVCALTTAKIDLWAVSLFLRFIRSMEPDWTDLNALSRKQMEAYFTWCRDHAAISKTAEPKHLSRMKYFLEYIQLADYPEAPQTPIGRLIFPGDITASYIRDENAVKYIPESVIQQLEENLEHLYPVKYIPVVILLRATGWRISDVMNLRCSKCLEKTAQGWYLCGDIPKTGVLNHRVPITDEVAAVVQTVIAQTRKQSTPENNPNDLLFVMFYGRRRGLCYSGCSVRIVLNKLAKRRNIIDDNGEIFHFKNHAFRHTKGVELINNGMNLLHVQKWMAHLSPEMTLTYAKILDTTLRKSWEEATRQGLFRVNQSGNVTKVDISEIENEDLIEWEYIRHHLDAVRMPLGYCMKPKKQECHTQLNPCLTCRNLCTTPEFISQYEAEMRETMHLIELGKKQGREVWVEKNTSLLYRYEKIVATLRTGKIHHMAGKDGREFIGEERKDVT